MSMIERKLDRAAAMEYAESLSDVFTPDGFAGVVAYVFTRRDAVVVDTRAHERVWRFSEITLIERAPREVPSVPDDFPVRVLAPGEAAADRATCGECGRSWDDGVITGWTPAPAARCPFESFH